MFNAFPNSKVFKMNAIVIQCYTCISASVGGFAGGTMLGWGTTSVPMLQSSEAEYPLSSDQIGWVMSVLGAGTLIGAVAARLLLDIIGRKLVLILTMVPMIVSYTMMAVSSDYPTILIGRFIGGIGLGTFISTGPLYIGEVAENRVRGAMGAFNVVNTNLGYLFMYIVSPYTTFSQLNAICAYLSAGLTIILPFIPESPYYYLSKGATDKAESTLIWLRRTSNVKQELQAMKNYVDGNKMRKRSVFDLVTNKGNRRALTILLILQTMQPLAGTLAIPAYAYNIFNDAGYKMSTDQSVTLMGIVMLIASFVGVFFVDDLGRRPVMYYSSFIMTLSLIVLGTFYILKASNHDVTGITWLPIAAVMVYVAIHSAGLHSLPFILLSEYFPSNVKAKGSMVFTVIIAIGGSASLKLFQLCADGLGYGYTFLICAVILVLSTVILLFIMPETKGCSLQKIVSIHEGLEQADAS